MIGVAIGMLAAGVGALYTVFARYGIARGMAAQDLTFLRFAVGGVVMLPVLGYHVRNDGLALASQWRIWLAVALLAGPVFGLLMFTALQFAPGSHAAVMPFSAMSIVGTLLAVRLLGESMTYRKLCGIGVVLCGLVILSGMTGVVWTPEALAGDALLVIAGSLWAGFGIMMRKHRLHPMLATAVVCFCALVSYVPVYLLMTGAAGLREAPPSLLTIEVLVQGVIAGAGTVYTYAKTVQFLGASRAAVFPALAPGLATLIAWPVLGLRPEAFEVLGLALVIIGLLVSVTTGPASARVLPRWTDGRPALPERDSSRSAEGELRREIGAALAFGRGQHCSALPPGPLH